MSLLPHYPQHTRIGPNSLLRSALFSIGNEKQRPEDRPYYRDKLIAATKGIEIIYTGTQLLQSDLDVFLSLVNAARDQPLGNPVRFSASQILDDLGRGRGGARYAALEDCVRRLNATGLEVRTALQGMPSEGFGGSLIRKFHYKDETTGQRLRQWTIHLEPEIINLFGPNAYSRLDWELRLSLTPTGKWLHAFYSTHASPLPVSLARLLELTGSEMKPEHLRQLRKRLPGHLEPMLASGFITDFRIDEHDRLTVVRG